MNKKTQKIYINSDYITLAQFLKFADVIRSGGEAKLFLKENKVYVNEELDTRRGKKLREGDVVKVDDQVFEILKQ